MEFSKRFKSFSTCLIILFLTSCASVDDSLFESSEEETRNVLNDSYVVEEQKKLGEYKPDLPTPKALPMSKGRAAVVKNPKIKEKQQAVVTTSGVRSKEFSLSQSPAWLGQDVKSQALWKSFSPNYIKSGERQILKVSYTGINAATVVLDVMPNVRYQSRDVFHFHARAKTSDFYKWIYSLNDTVDSIVDKNYFVSWKYSQIQKEKNKDIDDIQFYDRKNLMTFTLYKKTKNGETSEEKKQAEIPFYGMDYFSSLYFMRGLPLKNGDHYLFPITTKAETWLMSLRVVAREKVKIGIGSFDAIKLEVITKYTGELAKKGSMFLWVSDDANRALLSASAEVKIGSIKLELLEYRLGEQIIHGKQQ